MLQLKYFSDIPRTSGRTPDVKLRVRDATLCIIGHLAPNLGECPDVFLLLQVKYFSDILRMSGRTPDVQLCAMATAFLRVGQLVPNSAERSDVFPFCYDSNISLIYCGRPVGLRMSESAQWPRRFVLSDNSRPTRPSVPMFFLS